MPLDYGSLEGHWSRTEIAKVNTSILSNTINPFYIQKMLAVNVIVVTRELIESEIRNYYCYSVFLRRNIEFLF